MQSVSAIIEIEAFSNVRVIYENNEPLFCAKDVAKVLGFKDTINAIKQHCKHTTRREVPHPQSPGKLLAVSFIPEGDVYRLIFHSRTPEAKRFTRFVCHEVLPSIRKYGAYISPKKLEEIMSDPMRLAEMIAGMKKRPTPFLSETGLLTEVWDGNGAF